jgi:ankyrin repeat protein
VLVALLKLGAEVNAVNEYGQTPFALAAREGRSEVAEYLVDNGAEVQPKSDDLCGPVSEAVYYGHENLARLLIDAGAKPTLHQAIDCRHLGPVRQLINHDANG